jgi:hypothetical protein
MIFALIEQFDRDAARGFVLKNTTDIMLVAILLQDLGRRLAQKQVDILQTADDVQTFTQIMAGTSQRPS